MDPSRKKNLKTVKSPMDVFKSSIFSDFLKNIIFKIKKYLSRTCNIMDSTLAVMRSESSFSNLGTLSSSPKCSFSSSCGPVVYYKSSCEFVKSHESSERLKLKACG